VEDGLQEVMDRMVVVVKGQILSLSLNTYSCRVLQKIFEVIPNAELTDLISELKGNIRKIVDDKNGCHVVQKCLERANQSDVVFVLEEIVGHAKAMSLRQYSCHVIQKVIECCGAASQTRAIMAELLPSIIELTKDRHGNYVV
jgi:pumilio RNA-binding family